LVVRDHVPVGTENIEDSPAPSAEFESDVEKSVDGTTVILPKEKEKFALAKIGVGRDAAL
jgi:hypothetical protein